MNKNELHKIAPNLSKINSKQVFSTPENYFKEVNDIILTKLKEEELQNNITDTGFELPETYFNTVEDIVLAKLKAEAINKNNASTGLPSNYFDTLEDKILEKPKTKIISLKVVAKKLIPVAVAASLLLVFILNKTSESTSFESMEIAEIEHLIDNGFVEVNDYNLMVTLEDFEVSTEDFSHMTDEEVLDYLNTNDIDELLLEN